MSKPQSMTDGRDVESSGAERTPLLNSGGADGNAQYGGIGKPQDHEGVVLVENMPFKKLALIMSTAWIGVFLMALDSTIIATLAAPISSEFRSLNLLSWLATAYLISSAAVVPITGRLTDIFGRGPGLVVSNILFAAGNLICGLATDKYTILLGRFTAGLGGGGLRSIQNFLASDLVPLRQRGIVQGVANLCYCSGAMLGGVIGGLLSDYTELGWRTAFLAQVPPSVISAVAVLLLVKIPPKQSDKSYLARIDYLGVCLSFSCTVLMLLGLNSGGNLVPWIHPLPLVTIPLALLMVVIFVWWETRAAQPIIPVKLLLDRTIFSISVTSFLSDMVFMSAIFYVPLYLEVLGHSATSAGRKILPSPIGDSLGALGAGYFMRRTGKYVPLGVPSLALIALGAVFFAQQTASSPGWYSSAGFFFLGTGYGAIITTTQVACVASVDHSNQAVVMSAICA